MNLGFVLHGQASRNGFICLPIEVKVFDELGLEGHNSLVYSTSVLVRQMFATIGISTIPLTLETASIISGLFFALDFSKLHSLYTTPTRHFETKDPPIFKAE